LFFACTLTLCSELQRATFNLVAMVTGLFAEMSYALPCTNTHAHSVCAHPHVYTQGGMQSLTAHVIVRTYTYVPLYFIHIQTNGHADYSLLTVYSFADCTWCSPATFASGAGLAPPAHIRAHTPCGGPAAGEK
jgi:hypothetical protein